MWGSATNIAGAPYSGMSRLAGNLVLGPKKYLSAVES